MEGKDSGPYTAPPGWGESFIVGTSLTNGKTHDKTQSCRRGMEGLPTFRKKYLLIVRVNRWAESDCLHDDTSYLLSDQYLASDHTSLVTKPHKWPDLGSNQMQNLPRLLQ